MSVPDIKNLGLVYTLYIQSKMFKVQVINIV